MNLIALAVRRPVLVWVFFIMITVLGLFSIGRLPVNLVPQVNIPVVTISTVYPGAGPEQIETKVTKQIEDAVSTTNHLKHVYSISMEGVSIVMAEFTMLVAPEEASADVREKISGIRSQLPADAKDPEVLKLDINATPVLYVALAAPDLRSAYDLADRRIKPLLQTVPGVGNVDIIGGLQREIRVEADPDRMAAYGIDLDTIASRLARENVNIPTGRYTLADREVSGRLNSEFAAPRELLSVQIPLGGNSGSVPLASLARVVDTYAEVRSTAKVDGRDAVAFVIQKQPNANTIQVVDDIRKAIAGIRRQLPASYQMDVIVDYSTFIREAVADVRLSLILGVLITGLVLFLFLHSAGSTLVVTLAIPVSLITTMFFMFLADFSLNILSLSSLAICLGALVDASIVVLENIFRHTTELKKELRRAAVEGSGEVIGAVTTSIFTNIVVFLPIAFLTGIVGQFFREFGMIQVFATLISLAAAFTLLPMLASRLLKPGRENRFGRWFESEFSRLREGYRRVLSGVLRRPAAMLILVPVLLIGSLSLLPLVGAEFAASPDQGISSISLRLPPGTNLARTSETVARIEERLRKLPELERTFTTIGDIAGGGMSAGSQGPEYAQIVTLWKDRRKRSATEIMAEVKPFLAAVPGATMTVIEASSIAGEGGSPFQVYVAGPDWRSVEASAPQVLKLVQQTAGISDSDISYHAGKPEINIAPKRQKLADLDLSPAVVGTICRAALEGVVPTTFRQGDEEYDIRVTIPTELKRRRDILENLPVTNNKGDVLFLRQLAEIQDTSGPTTRERYDRSPSIGLTANINRDLGSVMTAFRAGMKKLQLPRGVFIIESGEAEIMKEGFRDLITALLLSVILVYLVMAAQFESWTEPLILMGTLPLAAIGIFFGLFVFGKTINIFSLMGFIILAGVGVNNGILIITFAKELFNEGKDALASVIEAASLRLKPILMTSLTMVTATLPLAFQPGKASAIKSPMGVVIISGVASCTVLTLYIIPFIYYRVLLRRERRRARTAGA